MLITTLNKRFALFCFVINLSRMDKFDKTNAVILSSISDCQLARKKVKNENSKC
jgi:hypothetical protein